MFLPLTGLPFSVSFCQFCFLSVDFFFLFLLFSVVVKVIHESQIAFIFIFVARLASCLSTRYANSCWYATIEFLRYHLHTHRRSGQGSIPRDRTYGLQSHLEDIRINSSLQRLRLLPAHKNTGSRGCSPSLFARSIQVTQYLISFVLKWMAPAPTPV